MKLNEITPETISKASTKELLSLHHRIHQLSGVASKHSKPSQKIIDLLNNLEKIHNILVNEMSRRKFKHQSNLTKMEGTLMAKLEQYIEFLLDTATDKFIFGEVLQERVKKWIPKMKKGALHKQLGVPEDQKIPAEKLKVQPGDSPKLKKRKILAKTLKKISKKRSTEEETE